MPRPRCSGADRGERHGMVVDNMLNITVPPCLVWDLTLAISEQFRSMRPTQAKSTLADQSEHKGQSYRFLYAKTLNQLGTNFQLMGYRYSTSGFYTLSDTMYKHMDGYEFNDGDDEDTPMWSRYYNLFYTKRGKLQVNISQQLGEYGSFYLSGSQQTYWHTDQQDRLLQFGYNTQIKDLSLGGSWNYSKSRGQPDADQVFALNFSLPLNLLLPRSNDSYTRKKITPG